jgi:hypothetical protein
VVFEGEASRVTDVETLESLAAVYRTGGVVTAEPYGATRWRFG